MVSYGRSTLPVPCCLNARRRLIRSSNPRVLTRWIQHQAEARRAVAWPCTFPFSTAIQQQPPRLPPIPLDVLPPPRSKTASSNPSAPNAVAHKFTGQDVLRYAAMSMARAQGLPQATYPVIAPTPIMPGTSVGNVDHGPTTDRPVRVCSCYSGPPASSIGANAS
jgi:hypothetical protein